VENIQRTEFGEVLNQERRADAHFYKKHLFVRPLRKGDIDVSKQRLLNNAIHFFTEARMVCDSALNSMREVDTIREERHE